MNENRSDSAAEGAAVLTASDTIVFPKTRAVYVGGAGNISVKMAGSGVLCLFSGIPAGTLLPISITQLMLTNTTATLVVGLN